MSEPHRADHLVLLPGQAAAVPGPADLTMTYVVHHGFRRDLDDFNTAATATPAGDRRTWRALLVRWDLFCLLLTDHHHDEDLTIWPLLRERCAEAADPEWTVLDETEAEHDAIDDLLPSVREALVVCAAEGPPVDTPLCALLERARSEICAHLAHEERDALRVLQRHLGGPEWDQLESQLRRGLRPAVRLRLAPWSMKGLPPAVGARLRESGGPALRLALRLGTPSFRRLDRAAFRHAR